MDTNDKNACDLLPPTPVSPEASDCCGNGCSPCVYDIYEADLKSWKIKCEKIKNNEEQENYKDIEIISENHWTEFKIENMKQVSHDTFLYTFFIPEEQSLGLNVGQHIILKQLKDGKPIQRQYTPISSIKQRGSFDIIIKIYPNGPMTQIIRNWKIGDMKPWRGPYGNFSYIPNKFRHVVLLAAGTGIAPIFQVIQAILNNEDDETFIKLLYASQGFEHILLRDELLDFCQYWNFSMCHYLSKECDESMKKYNERVLFERLTKEYVTSELKSCSTGKTGVLICGTRSFEKDMVNSAKSCNIPEEHIIKF